MRNTQMDPLEARRLLASAVSYAIYHDVNRNGIQDAGEIAPSNVSGIYAGLYLDANNDGIRNSNETVRSGSGSISLAAGTYTFRMYNSEYAQTEPAGDLPIVITVDGIAPGQIRFGVYPLRVQIKGRMYYDANQNGQYDSLVEPGYAGVRVYLDLNDDDAFHASTEPSALTQADGTYTFSTSTSTPRTRPLRASSPLPFASPAGAFWSIDISPQMPTVLDGLDFSIQKPIDTPFVVSNTTLTIFGNALDENLSVGCDPATDDLLVNLDGFIGRYPTAAITKVEWLAVDGADTLDVGNAGVIVSVIDSGASGAARILGTSAYDRFQLTAAYTASLTVGQRNTLVSWVSTNGVLPSLSVELLDGTDSAVLSATALGSGTSGFASAALFGGEGDDAFRSDTADVVLHGGDGDDRFYVRNASAQTLVGDAGVDGAASDAADVLDGVEQSATASLSGGNFTDIDLDGLLPPGQIARGWPNSCSSTNSIARVDALEADIQWNTYDPSEGGGFALTGLLPGTYAITGALSGNSAPSWYGTTGDGQAIYITLSEGEASAQANLGWASRSNINVQTFLDVDGNGAFRKPPDQMLTDRVVWLDLDDDGIRDAGEPTTKDSYQGFPATALKRGTYVFRSTTQAGWGFTSPGGERVVYTVSQHAQTTPLAFGQRPPVFNSSVSGRVTYVPSVSHFSPDGVGKGVAGALVYLDTNGNRHLDFEEPRMNADANGNYRFDGLPPWVYLSVGYNAIANVESLNEIITVNLQYGNRQANFGEVLPYVTNRFNGVVQYVDDSDTFADRVPADLTLLVYVDANSDGVRQASEVTAPVESSGYFSIDVTAANASRISVDVPAGFVLYRTFANGATYPTLRLAPASGAISGRVLLDVDTVHSVDRSDPTLGGRTVYLDSNNNGSLDLGEAQTLSDVYGAYTLFNVPAGPTTIRVAADETFMTAGELLISDFAPTAWLKSADILINLAPPTSGNSTLSGQVKRFEQQTSSMPPIYGYAGHRVYVDYDLDGVRDDNEPSAVSAVNGTYFIASIQPGAFPVRVEPSRGWAEDGFVTMTFLSGKHIQRDPLIEKGTWNQLTSGISLDEATPTAWYRFDDDVSASLTPATCTIITPAGELLYATAVRFDAATNTATWSLPVSLWNVSEAFIYINSRSIISESRMNNPEAIIKPQHLRIVRGDLTGDGVANFDDLLVLAQNYNRSGMNYSQGNLDRDAAGLVNFDDLLILAQSYGDAAVMMPLAQGGEKAKKRRVDRPSD